MGEKSQGLSPKRIEKLLTGFGIVFLYFLGLLTRYQIVDPLQKGIFVRSAFLQRQKGVPVSLGRGNILDRHGVPLHYPHWESALAIFPSRLRDISLASKWLSEVFPNAGLGLELSAGNGVPCKVIRELSPDQIYRLLSEEKPGLAVVPEEIRYGPESLARHVVGHVRPNAYLSPRDNIGEGGLEQWFQEQLVGSSPAWAGTVVAGDGRELPGTGLRIGVPPDPPSDLWTTLDLGIQLAVERIFDKNEIEKGAVVVLDAATGEILAMASRPQFDQNHPERSLTGSGAPFVNRAISGFTPGSMFKPVVLACALEKGYVKADQVFRCDGKITVGSRTIECEHGTSGHGMLSIDRALALSCNSTFMQIGLRIAPYDLVDFARKCGFGKKAGIPLPEESEGILPDPSTMLLGDIANFSMGQGYLTVTPLQVSAFFRAIIDDGRWIKPRLILGQEREQRTIFSKETARILKNALLKVTREGIGDLAWVHGFGSAGQTGTAQTGPFSSQTHAWFCGWAPLISPKFVVCVFVEEGGDGPTLAAPIFREIVEEILYFDRFAPTRVVP